MYLKVLACDLDGTLVADGRVEDATWRLLRDVKAHGFVPILVTGRRLDSFVSEGPFTNIFEAVVAEDGAAVYLPVLDSVLLPFGRLSSPLVRGLEQLQIPLEFGVAIAATHVPHDAAAVDARYQELERLV